METIRESSQTWERHKDAMGAIKSHLEAMIRDGWNYRWEGAAYRLSKAGESDRIVGVVMVGSGYAIRELKVQKVVVSE